MATYCRGDVILARMQIGDHGEPKVRPAVVIGLMTGGDILVYPVSHKPPRDQPFIPIGPGDFSRGGLDIADESYVLAGRALKIRHCAVAGKKGDLSRGAIDAIAPEARR